MLQEGVALNTPEGVELRLAVAGPFVRAIAWFIDLMLRALVYLLLAVSVGVFFISAFRDSGVDGATYFMGLGLIAFFLLEWFFTAVPEALFGTTPGKKIMGLYVVHSDGTPLTWQGALLRNFLRFADFLPLLYFSAIVSMLIDSRSRRLGDLAASSVVVNKNKAPVTRATTATRGEAPPLPLSASERRAILEFDDRCDTLTAARQIELAEILQSLGVGQGSTAVTQLRQWALWIRTGQTGAASAKPSAT